MSEQIIAKLDEIEANTVAKIEESKAEAVKAVEEAVISFDEKVAALEAKVSQMGATPAIKTYKSIGAEVNRMVKEQLKSFVSGEAKVQKEIKMFEDAGQYDAYFKEASALTGSGAGIGGRTAYDPVFVPWAVAWTLFASSLVAEDTPLTVFAISLVVADCSSTAAAMVEAIW